MSAMKLVTTNNLYDRMWIVSIWNALLGTAINLPTPLWRDNPAEILTRGLWDNKTRFWGKGDKYEYGRRWKLEYVIWRNRLSHHWVSIRPIIPFQVWPEEVYYAKRKNTLWNDWLRSMIWQPSYLWTQRSWPEKTEVSPCYHLCSKCIN